MPRVAVITRTKDRPIMLPRARKSIEHQTYRDFVWVIVNDAGSRDYVEENAEAAKKAGAQVDVVHRDISTGMEAASNAGVRATDCEFVVIHDDDDSWQPEFLNECVDYLDSNLEFVGVTSRSYAVYEKVQNGQVAEIGRSPYNDHLESVQLADMLIQNQYAPISFVFRRSAYDAVGGFDESLPVLGDWDFNLRILLNGDIGVVPGKLANYHIREHVPADQVIYGNSITAGVNIHLIQDAKYRNLKLRQDLEMGKPGLGFLLCQGRQFLRVTAQLSLVSEIKTTSAKVWRKFKTLFGRR